MQGTHTIKKKIYKYHLALYEYTYIRMPKGAPILSAGMQGSSIMIWALVDIDELSVNHTFIIKGTGSKVEFDIEKETFIGTVFQNSFVWHIFDAGEEKFGEKPI